MNILPLYNSIKFKIISSISIIVLYVANDAQLTPKCSIISEFVPSFMNLVSSLK